VLLPLRAIVLAPVCGRRRHGPPGEQAWRAGVGTGGHWWALMRHLGVWPNVSVARRTSCAARARAGQETPEQSPHQRGRGRVQYWHQCRKLCALRDEHL